MFRKLRLLQSQQRGSDITRGISVQQYQLQILGVELADCDYRLEYLTLDLKLTPVWNKVGNDEMNDRGNHADQEVDHKVVHIGSFR